MATLCVAGCELPMDCPLRACGDPIVVRLVGVDMADEPVLTMLIGDDTPIAMDCRGDGECWMGRPIGEQRPEQITLVLELPDTTISRTYAPDYERYYPNGEECGPTCWQADVTFTVE